MTFDTERLGRCRPAGFALATDVAEWLVRQGVPFRDAHEAVGDLRARCASSATCDLDEVSDADLAAISAAPDAGRPRRCCRGRRAGGPCGARAAPRRCGSASSSPTLADAGRGRGSRGRRATDVSRAARACCPRPVLVGGARPARRRCCVPCGRRRPAHRGRGVRRCGRRRVARVPWPDAPHRGDVRSGRVLLRLLLLRHALVRQRGVRAGGGGRRGAAARRRGRRAGWRPARLRRPAARTDRELARGPARLCAALGVDGAFDGVDLLAGGPLQLVEAPPGTASPRVGTGAPGRDQQGRGPALAVLGGWRSNRQPVPSAACATYAGE